MKIQRSMIALLLVPVIIGGCKKSSQPASGSAMPQSDSSAQAPTSGGLQSQASADDTEAIRKAIEAHVRDNKGINLAAMDMTVRNVQIHGDQAQADTEFRLKQGSASMQMTYSLERHADGWIVVHNQPSGGQFQHPPMDQSHSGAAPGSAGPAMPDVGNFLKDHPAPTKQ